MRPDPTDAFAPLLAAVETGSLVRVTYEVLPGPSAGPAGIGRVSGVVVDHLGESGDPDPNSIGRYYKSIRLRDGRTDPPTDYRLDYRGGAVSETWLKQFDGEDPFDGSDTWGTGRRVYSLAVEGSGITARRERPGHSFIAVPNDSDHE